MKIRIALLTVAFGVIVSMNIQAQEVHGFIELKQRVDKSGVNPIIDAYIHASINDKYGWSCFLQKTKGWGQLYCGPTLASHKWIEVSGSIGVQQGGKLLRVADSVWIGKGKFSVFHVDEYGNGYWTQNVFKAQLSKSFSIGGHGQRFIGMGPYVEMNLKKVTVWGTLGVGAGQPKGLFGIKYHF